MSQDSSKARSKKSLKGAMQKLESIACRFGNAFDRSKELVEDGMVALADKLEAKTEKSAEALMRSWSAVKSLTPDLSKKEKASQDTSGSETVYHRQCRSADGVLPAAASTHAVKESPQERERRYHGPVRDISDAAVRRLIMDILQEKYPGRFPEHGWIVEKKSEGTFHRVFTIQLYDLPNDGEGRGKQTRAKALPKGTIDWPPSSLDRY